MSTAHHLPEMAMRKEYERLLAEGNDVELRKQLNVDPHFAHEHATALALRLDGLALWKSFIRDFLVANYDVNPRIFEMNPKVSSPSKKTKQKNSSVM